MARKRVYLIKETIKGIDIYHKKDGGYYVPSLHKSFKDYWKCREAVSKLADQRITRDIKHSRKVRRWFVGERHKR